MISEEVLKLLLPALVIPVLLIATDGAATIFSLMIDWIARGFERFR